MIVIWETLFEDTLKEAEGDFVDEPPSRNPVLSSVPAGIELEILRSDQGGRV